MLVGQIIAQRTKLNPWEFVATKVGIPSFVVPNNRTTVPVIKLISILQSGRNGESVFYFYFYFFRAWTKSAATWSKSMHAPTQGNSMLSRALQLAT